MEEEDFKRLFPVTPNQELANQMGISVTSVIRQARSLGLQKAPGYLHDLRHDQGVKAMAALQARGIHKGANHYNWKGGNPWKRFADPRYIEWRTAVLERDNYICQKCGRKCRKNEKGLAAHHLQSYTYVPELRYEVSNGLTLCRQCHMKLHGKEYKIEMIPCACGCGTMIPNKDKFHRRPRQYVNFHAPKVVYKENPRPSQARKHEGEMIPCACGCGEMITRVGAGGKLRTHIHGHKSKKRPRKGRGEMMIPCKCGCGTMIHALNEKGQPISFVPGHSTRYRYQQGPVPQAIREKMSEGQKRRAALNKKPVEMVPCACGCGTMIPSRDASRRRRRFVNHHGRRKQRE